MEFSWSPAVATAGNRWQMADAHENGADRRKPLPWVATGQKRSAGRLLSSTSGSLGSSTRAPAEYAPPWRSTVRTMHEHEHGKEHFGAAEQSAEWDARYRERERAMWSGQPNGRLVAEVAALTPGRALDVGCGEGADAIWLARRGWTVTAIDISDVAVGRAREAAERAGAAVECVCGNALLTPFPARSFDLVSMQYPALPKAAGEAAVRALLDTVRPGRLLLAVYHDLDDEHRKHMKSRGVDPADYVGADDLGRLVSHDFTIELRATEPRIDPPPDTPHIADVVLRARRL